MKPHRLLTLRYGLPLAMVLISLAAGAAHHVFEVRGHVQNMTDDLHTRFTREVARLGQFLEGELREGDGVRVDETVASLGDDPEIVLAELVDPHGTVIAATRRALIGRAASDEFRKHVDAAGVVVMTPFVGLDGGHFHLLQPVWMSTGSLREQKPAYLHVVRDLRPAIAEVHAAAVRESLQFAVFAGGLVLLVWLTMHRFLTRPLGAMAQAARGMGAGNLSVRVPVTGLGETRALAAALNGMADDLRRSSHDIGALQSAVDEHAIVSITDLDGRIRRVNDRFCQVSGYAREDLVGQEHSMLDSGTQGASFYADLWQTLRAGATWRGVIENRRRDGAHYWVATTIVPVADEHGRIDEFIAVHTDISRQVRLRNAMERLARADLADGANEFENIVAAVRAGLGNRWTLLGRLVPDDGEVEVEVLGFRNGDSFGRTFAYPLAGTPCELADGRREAVCIPDGVIERFPTNTLLADLGARSYRGEPILDSAGRELGVLAVIDDRPCEEDAEERALMRMAAVRAGRELERARAAAERARLQDQLLQAQKMEAIGQLTGGIAHDFNNILASIIGYTELSQRRAGTDPEGKLGRYLGEVQKAAERARDMIGKMLTFSRRSATTPKPLDPVAVAEEAMGLLRASIPASVGLHLEHDGGTARVLADPTHLHQALVNLCVNARDALAGKGEVVIGVHRRVVGDAVCASCHRSVAGDYVSVSVTDDGPGVPADVLPSLFEPFFTTKEVGKGTGLGLAMVHGIAHDGGGHVLVTTAPGKGTRFELLLPASDTPRSEPRAEPLARSA